MSNYNQPSEERKRLIELVAMVFISVLLVALSRLESNIFELSRQLTEHQTAVTTIVYFGLININVVLILVLTFLIFRNVVKLVLERRRGVFGSRLRSKLMIILIFFALAPTALMFYVSTRFLAESFETWFSSKVEETMFRTREAGALVYKRDKRRIESLARIALQRIEIESAYPFSLGPAINVSNLDGFTRDYRLFNLRVFDKDGKLLWSGRPVKSSEEQLKASLRELLVHALRRFIEDKGLTSISVVDVDEGRDVVRGITPIYDQRSKQLLGVVLAEERFETQIIQSVESIMREFANLKPGAKWTRLSYVILLVLMALIIFFSAIWLGFYVSKSIIGPIQSLGEATREVSLGNYEVYLPPRTDDETGQLVRSFNRMTSDLKTNQNQLLDFTDRLEKTNEELEQRRKYMEVVLRNISAGVVSVNAQSIITSVNRAAERLLGIDASKSLNIEVKDALGQNLWEVFWQPIVDRVEHTASFHGQIDLGEIGRSILLIADAVQIQDENDEDLGMVVVFDDASEQVKVQRVAAWREVARRIAHEIKNPITPIKLSAQRLLRRFEGYFSGKDREVFKSCIETIVAEVDSLRDLVNEFSKFSRLPTVKTRPGNLNEIIKDVVNLYELSFSDLYYRVELDSQLPLLAIDKEQMNRVFNNLFSNAVSALGGNVGEKVLSVRSFVLSNYKTVRVEVADNGNGIPDNIKSKVMEPYFSTKKDGTGLGLAIVNQIISEHGGYLRIVDNKPKGTILIIELPLGKEDPIV